MARSSRSFALATQASVDEANAAYEPVEFEFTDPDAVPEKGRKTVPPRICTAYYPGDGVMFSMAASVGMTNSQLLNPAGSLVKFLSTVFHENDDFRFIWEQVEKSRLDVREDIMALVAELMESWSGVPTQQ